MKYCSKCGSALDDDAKFCKKCGEPTEANEEQQTTTENKNQSDFSEKLKKLNETNDSTEDFDKNDIEQNKAMAVLSYISWLVLIPIFAAKNSPFARFHANQGLVLALTELVWWILETLIVSLLSAISISLVSFFALFLGLVNVLFLVLAIIGIVNAVSGKAKELPVIGKFKILNVNK